MKWELKTFYLFFSFYVKTAKRDSMAFSGQCSLDQDQPDLGPTLSDKDIFPSKVQLRKKHLGLVLSA